MRKEGHVVEESVPNLIQAPDLDAIVAILRKRAEQEKIKLPTDVALYLAQNLRSNARALEGALVRLIAHSSLTGTAITLAYTQRVLKNFLDTQPRKGTVDPLHLLTQQLITKEAKVRPQYPIAAESNLVFCLLKTRDGGKISRIRRELEVNMRESERERLARRDAYERELERRAKKRKQG
jgi:hypothetical protein